jgi:hypothetical protein
MCDNRKKTAIHDAALSEITGPISPIRYGAIATENPLLMADCDEF